MSSGKIRRIDYYPDEYISGVGGVLRADEQGVYWMVCSLIMSEGGPVPFDARRMAGLCRLRPADIKRIVGVLVERGKLALNDGKLSQKRAQSEIERAAKRIQSAAENGAKGGRPRQKSERNQQNAKAGGSAGEKLTTNYQPPTIDTPSDEGVVPRTPSPTPLSELEKVLDHDHAAAVIEHRKAKKSKLTAHIASNLAKQLAKWPDPNEAADEMMLAGWTGFKPEWLERRLADSRGPPMNGNGRKTGWQRQREAFEELDDERSHPASPERTFPSLPKPGAH